MALMRCRLGLDLAAMGEEAADALAPPCWRAFGLLACQPPAMGSARPVTPLMGIWFN